MTVRVDIFEKKFKEDVRAFDNIFKNLNLLFERLILGKF